MGFPPILSKKLGQEDHGQNHDEDQGSTKTMKVS